MALNSASFRIIHGAIAVGAFAAIFGTSVAFADQGRGHGGRAKGHDVPAVASASAQPTAGTSIVTMAENAEDAKGSGNGSHGVPGLSGEASLQRRHGAAGILSAIDGQNLTLTTKHGPLTVVVTDDTAFRMKAQDSFTLDDLSQRLAGLTGEQQLRLNVNGEPSAEGLTARRIIVRVQDGDEARNAARTVGVASGVSATGLTVTPAGGAPTAFQITSDTRVVLPAGVIGLRDGQTVAVTHNDDSVVAKRIRVQAES